MASKSIWKIVSALGVLAIVLIVLGVNFVPKIFASPSSSNTSVDASIATRSNYTNESFQRSISSQLSLSGSDWIERHPALLTQAAYYAGSDWIERHPSSYFSKSDYYERHPAAPK